MTAAIVDDEFSYVIPERVWRMSPATVLRNARILARRRRKHADGEPVVHVVLVWPQRQHTSTAA